MPTPQYKDVMHQSASQSCRDRYQHPYTKTSSIGISKLQRSIPTPQYKDLLNRHLKTAEIDTNTPIQRRPQWASQCCRDRYQHPDTKTSSIGISKLHRSIPTPRYKDVLNRHLKAAEIDTNTPIQKTSSIGISKLQRSVPTPQYKDVLDRHLKAA